MAHLARPAGRRPRPSAPSGCARLGLDAAPPARRVGLRLGCLPHRSLARPARLIDPSTPPRGRGARRRVDRGDDRRASVPHCLALTRGSRDHRPLIGLAAQAGDLAESMVKRAADRKESGFLFRPRRILVASTRSCSPPGARRLTRCWLPAPPVTGVVVWVDRLDRASDARGARGIPTDRARRAGSGSRLRRIRHPARQLLSPAHGAPMAGPRPGGGPLGARGLEQLATLDGAEMWSSPPPGDRSAGVLAALGSAPRCARQQETLVTGGHLVARRLAEVGGDPLDRLRRSTRSLRHLAVPRRGTAERCAELILTASGGPFRGRAGATSTT